MTKNYNCKDCEIVRLAKVSADSYEFCLNELEKELKPFQDDYFQGLTKQQIAELAKKSIRLTTECSRLTHALEDVKEILNKECGIVGNAKAVGIINEVFK